jgi:AraC-like DNA-binding protein
MDIFDMALVFLAANGVVLIAALLKTSKRNSKYYLSALVFWAIIQNLYLSFLFSDYVHDYPHLIGVLGPFIYFIPTLYYFYIVSACEVEVNKAVHYIPLVFGLFIYMPFYLSPVSDKLDMLSDDPTFHLVELHVILTTIVKAYYLNASFKVIKQREQLVKKFFARTDIFFIDWLKAFSLALGITWLITNIVVLATPLDIYRYYSIIASSLIFYWMSFEFMRRSTLLIDTKELKEIFMKSSTHKIDQQLSSKIEQKIKEAMDSGFYLNQDLNIKTLADKIGHPSYQVSQTLNQKMGQTFYSYIQSKRLEHFIKLLKSTNSQSRTLLELAFESGFNSKSSFNEVFKRRMRMSPKEYRANLSE